MWAASLLAAGFALCANRAGFADPPAPNAVPQNPPARDLMSDTWAAADSLSRVLPMGDAKSADVPAPRPNRFVGIFYFIWQGGHGTPGPFDISELLVKSPQNPAYGPVSAFHWWGKPEAGYFVASDPWVIRRNMAMLQNAQVDTLLLDVTNAFTYPETVKAVCETMRQMRREGNQTPQIAFVTHAHAAETVSRLWNEVYKNGDYSELWFRWQEKPLLLADPNTKFDHGKPLPPEIANFFTFRYSWAWDAGQNKWPWIEKYPQKGGWSASPDVLEEMPVAVASHPTSNIGRSFHDGAQPKINEAGLTGMENRGLHFAEQWTQALTSDPQFVFVTGWNEWVAQRFIVAEGQKINFMGTPSKTGDTFFVDAYNGEYNRDIEPSDAYGDTLYYQLVASVRRYKGARPVPVSGPPKAVSLSGAWAQWNAVSPEYRDARGDTAPRNAPGWGDLHYTDTTGRNDFVSAKVAYDAKNVTFYVQCAQPITPRTGANWMQLFLDTDQNAQTGWVGYDFAVNLAPPLSDTKTIVSRYTGDTKTSTWQWKNAGTSAYRISGDTMAVQIPRALLGLAGTRIAFDFHWADNENAAKEGISAFFLHGDSAPDRRFNYRFDSGPLKPGRKYGQNTPSTTFR